METQLPELKSSHNKRLAIFASYDRNNIVNGYVIYYLKELKKVSDIIFVADNPLDETEKEKIRPLTIHTIAERHGEYDFGSYKRGYLWAEENLLDHYEQLIYCNDSVFGPFHPFDPIFSYMEKKQQVDFWGMFMVKAENREKQHTRKKDHAQSYFIVLNHKVTASTVFKDFMNGITKLPNKDDIIKEYEIGLSQMLINHGFHCDGYRSEPDNTPHRKGALLLIKNGFPFLKKSLFIPNYLNQKVWCYDLWRYKSIIARSAPAYPLDSIKDYLTAYIGKTNLRKQLFRLGFRVPAISKFFFYKKITKSGYLIIKVFNIIIYKKKF